MQSQIKKLKRELQRGKEYLSSCSESELNTKPTPDKWSRKEILGHLIDSATNNLLRFIEIQFEPKPYKVRRYDQDKLVEANDYNNSDLSELLQCWLGLNNRIIHLMSIQTEETLSYSLEIYENELTDLRFLMSDYVDHIEHHLNQICI